MKPLLLSFVVLFAGLRSPSNADEQADLIARYKPISLEGRFAAYMGPSPLILDAKLRNQMPKTYLDAIQFFGPAFIHNLSGGGSWEWHFDDGKALRCAGPYGKSLSAGFDAALINSGIIKIEPTNQP